MSKLNVFVVAIGCMFIGYMSGLIAGEIRVKTFWKGFTVSSIAIVLAGAISTLLILSMPL